MSPLGDALDRLVPAFRADGADWDDVLARSGERRMRRVVLAAVAVGAVALLATPAFGLRGFVADLLGRIDIPFTSANPAPNEVKAQFYDLSIMGAPGMATSAIAAQARKVATIRANGKTHVLYVAPTRSGGFCYVFTRAGGGCQPARPASPVGASWLMGSGHGDRWVAQVDGAVRSPDVRRVVLRYADGSSTDVRFYYVSKPIDAGFFLAHARPGHTTPATRLRAIEAFDRDGKLLAREAFPYVPPAVSGRPRPRTPFRPPVLPTRPTVPLQRATAAGVTAVAGANGVVIFDLSRASAHVRKLLHGAPPLYGCMRRLPYHPGLVDLSQGGRVQNGHIVIYMGGMRAPYDGCDIQGSYGHTWPDRNASHSIVELAFTARGRRFFEDRAAARDLVAFYRSKPYRTFRKLGGHALKQALLTSRYAGKLTPLGTVQAPLRAYRIGYVVRPDGVTFVERSPSGRRRFHITVRDGRARDQNVRGLAGILF